ncbi:hypothetical protein VTK73DRAFT_8875 [Phialemonium thermophilum]|uniref:Gti1/Pac2 family protein n=1 Tax=Phialemonium thermophilum TaxID=223376 RepID=A0ABR3W5X1_9PEZI
MEPRTIQEPPALEPTWNGHIATTMDALVLFEACLQGRINHLSRRPYDRERLGLIQSGNVFVYEEYSSGIKRWTDGRHWSPSRVLGNFLVYRELRSAFLPGMTRKVMRPRRAPHSDRRGSSDGQSDAEYALIGPLVDSYPFKPGGLVKKIIRVVLNGVPHHLVAYYTVEDIESGRLLRPSWDPTFSNIIPRPELVFQEGFRVPVDQEKDMLSDGGEVYPEYHQMMMVRGGDNAIPPGMVLGPGLSHEFAHQMHSPLATFAVDDPKNTFISLMAVNGAHSFDQFHGVVHGGHDQHPQPEMLSHESSASGSPNLRAAADPSFMHYYQMALAGAADVPSTQALSYAPPRPAATAIPQAAGTAAFAGGEILLPLSPADSLSHAPSSEGHNPHAESQSPAGHHTPPNVPDVHFAPPGYPICAGLGYEAASAAHGGHGGPINFDPSFPVSVG